MTDFLDNSAFLDVSPVDDVSPGDTDFSADDPEAFPEPSDNAVSEPDNSHTSADESGDDENTSSSPSSSVSPSSSGSSSSPTTPEVKQELQIIIISPDGTMTIYDEGGNITSEVADNAYSLWLSENNALEKRFENYSVSEALLLFIAVGSLVGLICKIFKRRKL